MKEKIFSLLKKEFHLPAFDSLRGSRFDFMLQEFPKKEELKTATKTFSRKEKFVFFAFVGIFAISSTYVLWILNENYMVEIPVKGGEIIEGVADVPRFINPLLATGEADRDLSTLIYSGLLRATERGYINDLAENFEISEDGLTYIFTIKEDAVWHDGKPVISDDIEFTINKAKDPVLRSPKRANWEGVSVERIDEKNIKFTLKQAFQPFLENLTMGILPKHKWNDIDSNSFVHSEMNIRAIGSGPYKIKKLSRQQTTGIPDSIELVPFKEFTLGEPKISKIIFKFYPNQEKLYEAYKDGMIKSMNAISPKVVSEILKKDSAVILSDLPRILAVFYNQSESKVLADKKVREALDTAIDKKNIIDDVLWGYGSPVDSPIPPGSLGFTPVRDEIGNSNNSTTTTASTSVLRIEKAREILLKNGWKPNEEDGIMEKNISKTEKIRLEFSLSTIDFTELKRASEIIKETWEKVGASVNLKIYEKGGLDRDVIEPRKYDALFFGQIVGRDLDLFSFWHSSQRKNPGVNISLYTNSKVDKLLEGMKTEKDRSNKVKSIEIIKDEIKKDIPATFIYSPKFIYVTPSNIKNIRIIPPTTGSDRFLNIHEWHINTERIWKIFL